MISSSALIDRKVQFGQGNIVHPHAILKGKIKIGTNNLFEETCNIINPTETQEMIIGNNNTFQTGSTFTGSFIGNNNILGIKSNCSGVIGDDCIITAHSNISSKESIVSKSIFSMGKVKPHTGSFDHIYHQKHLEFLKDALHKI